MMITAVDSSVLIAIINGEPAAADWVRVLAQARADSRLIICDVVYAESSVGLPTKADFDVLLARLGIEHDPINTDAAHLAGQIFTAYRKNGGPRQHMIPDFLIGAHAHEQADMLAASDRGYLRHCFPTLKLLQLMPVQDA